ncbi:hypothetical protein GCM10022223_01950 [Kineosporia mesophila]|uniref:SdpI/YhfL family protein n=1 Tax=Kineosporia mesophila TaxID=566012 RepID=A0ABP6YUL6_9ACTN|nr:hypothetical protein [Kineosporia mesophila]MCD5352320.1 hypothetical protein [Kineosporia mesophila]
MNGEDVLATLGLVLIVGGVIVMIVPMVRATVGSSAIGQVPPELDGVSVPDQAELRKRVQSGGEAPARDLPKLRAVADGMVARRIGLWFCLGGAIVALGLAVTDPTDPPRLVFCLIILAVVGFAARGIAVRARAGAAFLARHPR